MSKALVTGTEPLVLADGTKIDPASGKVIKDKPAKQFIEVPSQREAQRLVTNARRVASDLPAPPQQMNAISLVVMYTLYGLDDKNIALVTSLSEKQIGNIKMTDAYDTMYKQVTKTILDSDTDDVRNLIQAGARTAAKKVMDSLDSENEILAFKAAQDILDRSGHRPADVVEHKHSMTGGLTIEYIKREENNSIPMIDVTPVGEE